MMYPDSMGYNGPNFMGKNSKNSPGNMNGKLLGNYWMIIY